MGRFFTLEHVIDLSWKYCGSIFIPKEHLSQDRTTTNKDIFPENFEKQNPGTVQIILRTNFRKNHILR